MIKFPMKFEVEATSKSGIASHWTAKSHNLPPINSAIPPEFMGPGGGYSPEDLFAIAVLNCIIATYKVYMEKSGVAFQELNAKTIVTVDKNPAELGFFMSHLEFFIDVVGTSNPDQARKLLDKRDRKSVV